jgi:HEAT repeat protein
MIKKLARSIADKATGRSRHAKAARQTHAPVVEQTLAEPQQPLPASPVPGLIKQLRDPVAEVARDAALALGELNDTAAVDVLGAVVVNRENYFHSVVRSAAAGSLGKLKNGRALDALLTGLRDPIAEASQSAIRALGELGDERAVAPLIAVVQNHEGYFLPEVRQTARETLARFAAPAAVHFLRTLPD